VIAPGFGNALLRAQGYSRYSLSCATFLNERVCWSEFRSNDVYRRVELPAVIQVEKVSADYENGLLKIIAPKAQQPATVVPVSGGVYVNVQISAVCCG
jgi:hypothetical protein